MSKRVIFRIEQGDFEQGFPVTLTIRENGRMCGKEVRGKLAIAQKTLELYNKWQDDYKSWGESYRWWRRKIDAAEHMETNSSSYDLQHEAEKSACQFEEYFNTWLNNCSLEQITRQLLHTVGKNESVSFVVQTDNQELQKLPWEQWNFLQEYYNHAEVALGTASRSPAAALSGRVRILVILGSDENIEIETDGNIIQNKLPNAELVLLQKPDSSKLRDTLRSQPWNIIFFAGHSATRPDGNDGRIWLNESEYLSPAQLRISLIQAARNGLKLAIFNSCDGLGLARQLDSLEIPHIIVMREPIHDRVAQMFLNAFLTEFAKGASLHEAVREARDQLRLLENDSPKASWLPVIFQNPEEPPLFYPQPAVTIIQDPQPKPPEKKQKDRQLAWWGMGAIALISLAFIIYPFIEDKDSTRSPGISLGEEILSEKNSTPEKQAGIKAFRDKKYPAAVEYFQASLQKNPNDPEARIYLNNAKAANSKTTFKIAVSVPLGNNQPIAEEILRGVAEVQEKINQESGINGLPLQVVIANDNNDGALVKEVARKFVEDPTILAVVGHNASSASVVAAPIYKDGELVMVSATSFANQLKQPAYIFRMVPQITFFAAHLSKAIGNRISKPNVAMCIDPSPDNQSYKQEFQSVTLANGGKTVDLPCDLADLNFNPSTVVEAIKENKANSLLVSPHVNNLPKAIAILKAVRDSDLSIQLYGSPTMYTKETIQLGGKAVEGLTISVPYFPNTAEKEQQKKEFHARWGIELNTWRSPMAEDATKAIATGLQQLLKQNKPTTRQALDRILRDQNFKVKGLTGEFYFNSNTGEREFPSQQDRSDALIRIQDEQFVNVE
ncbi:ABC transporter substrate-binding protein [Microseira wollei]|uniref:Extracellular ligand-binding receptor n=1 Tax=Microseira wollei NIES-4236 TaxID=2530354 RepID=A0AAV3X9Q5_9CYAN|nr:ABC transporter substrate-binding protein [Microseira wollei]GET37027.1 extracellular ligand-binding receptor [Microseira wollei NIES-4236]